MRTGLLVACLPAIALAACLDIPDPVTSSADGSPTTTDGGTTVDSATDGTTAGDSNGPGTDSSAPSDTGLPPPDVVVEASCSLNLQTDPLNCGRCGHACEQGLGCSGSVCTPRVLRMGGGAISGLRLIGGTLYWMEGGSAVYGCPAPDCSSLVPIVTGSSILGFGVADTTAYTVEGASIMDRFVRAYSTTTPGAATDISWSAGEYGLAAPVDVDSQDIWFLIWLNGGPQAFGALSRADTDDSNFDVNVTTDVGNAILLRMATFGGNEVAFWTESGRLVRVPAMSSSSTTTMATGTGIHGLAVDSSSVFWTDEAAGTVQRCPATSDCSGPTLLRGGQASPSTIAVDSTGVAWTNAGSGASDGTLVECSYPDCTEGPFILADGQADPHEVALDSTYVYWAAGSDLMRVPR